MFVGVGAARVRDMFEQAKKSAPCIIFIDEIDAVGRHRGAGLGGGNDEREQTLNQMLVEMDGFETNLGVIVMAATNRPDILDPALLRPGRFDRQVYVTLPDVRGREQILNVHMRKVPVGQDIRADILARGTPGFSGADLANLVNEAALFAARRNGRVVEMVDFEKAKDKIMMGPERKSHGHARGRAPQHRLPRGRPRAGRQADAQDRPGAQGDHHPARPRAGRDDAAARRRPLQHWTRSACCRPICVLFGGRIAEEVFMNQMTTGASNDFERATQIARDMVTRYGMTDELGPMVYAENEGEVFLGRSVTKTTNMSEETMQKVDGEIRRIIDEQYAIARKLIEDNQDKMHAMAKALLEWETIDSEQIDDIMAGKPPRPPKDWTPSTHQAAAAGSAAGQHRRRAGRGLTRPERQSGAISTGPAGPVSFGTRSHRCIWQTTRFRIDLAPAAGDGHRQRHAGLVLRRRPPCRAPARRWRIASGWSREGADILDIGGESTRPGRAPPVASRKSWRACCRCCAGALRAGRAGVGRHQQARGDARGAGRWASTSSTTSARCARPARSRRWRRTRAAASA